MKSFTLKLIGLLLIAPIIPSNAEAASFKGNFDVTLNIDASDALSPQPLVKFADQAVDRFSVDSANSGSGKARVLKQPNNPPVTSTPTGVQVRYESGTIQGNAGPKVGHAKVSIIGISRLVFATNTGTDPKTDVVDILPFGFINAELRTTVAQPGESAFASANFEVSFISSKNPNKTNTIFVSPPLSISGNDSKELLNQFFEIPKISISPGETQTYFIESGKSLTGEATAVPEPLTILGSGLALGLGVYFKKEYSKKQKKEKAKA